MEEGHSISKLLTNWSDGDHSALDELFPQIYEELHRQARRYLRRENPGHTLQTTEVLHEAYIRLAHLNMGPFESRNQFFAYSAKIIRNILVDHARTKKRQKRGGGALRVSFSQADGLTTAPDVDLMALDEALERLGTIDPGQVRIVELLYFGGLSLEAAAEVLAVSRSTIAREWNIARAWLHRELTR